MTAMPRPPGFGPNGLLDVQSPAPRGLLDISGFDADIRRSAAESAGDLSRLPLPSLNLPDVQMQGLLPRPTPRPDFTPSPRPAPFPRPASSTGRPVQTNDKPTIAGALSTGAEHTGRFVEGQNVFTTGVLQHARGAKPYRALRTIKRLDPIYKGAGGALTIAQEGLGAIDDMNRGVPAQVAIPGAVLHGLGTYGAGAVAGGLVGSLLGPVGTVGGAMAGSYLADKFLPDREQLGKGFMKAYKAYGEHPYYGIS